MEQQPTIEQDAPKPKRHLLRILLHVVLVVLLIAALVAAGYYGWKQHQEITRLKSQEVTLTSKAEAVAKELDEAKKELGNLRIPGGSEMSPQCPGKYNEDTLLAPVNDEPVYGYKFYIVTCKNNKSEPRLIAFKVANDGKKTFAYGAASGDPMCVHAGIIKNAAEVSKAISIPVCKNT